MRNLTRSAILLAIGLICAQLCLSPGQSAFSQSPQSPNTKKAPVGTISGRITVQGKPKGGIVVGLRLRDQGLQGAPGLKGVSDADGHYQINDVPAGSYQVVPMSPAYVVSDYTSMSGPGKALVLTEGERVDGIDFSIIRGAVITGKVAHADGRPVIEEGVYLIAADQPDQSAGRYAGSGATQTDDRGIYRIYGLRAGRYKVCIGIPEEGFVSSRFRPTFQRTFYPGVTEIEEARVVEVSEGSEAPNIDITVGQTIKGFTASGVLIDGENNQPVPNIRIGVQKVVEGNLAPFIGSSAMTNARGEFRLDNVMPGKYSAFVMPLQNSDVLADPMRFEVRDQDVSGLTLRTAKGAVLSGFVVIEGTQDKQLYERLSKMMLHAFVRSADQVSSMTGSRMTTLGPDGGFRIGGLPSGTAMFSLSSPDRTQPGFLISRIERDGVIHSRGVELKPREEATSIRIIVTYGTGTVRGTVKWDNEMPPAGTRLMVRLTRNGENQASLRPEEVDARGRFLFKGVPAGDYRVTLNSFVRVAGNSLNVSQPVTVTDGAVAEVELIVDSIDKKPTP